jgi:hypothetical protein
MTIPLAEFAAVSLLGLGLAVVLVLFICLRRDLLAHIRIHRTQWAEMNAHLQAQLTRQALPLAIPDQPPLAPAQADLPPAFNFNRRFQANRLLRRGADAAQIARSLRIPRCEAELLARVHRFTAHKALPGTQLNS